MTQRDVVLRLLRAAGSKGISAHDLIYVRGITRGAAVIHALREEGHDIETIDEGLTDEGRKRLARYILKGIPEPAPIPPAPPAFRSAYQPLGFTCGCVRAPDGRSWQSRCAIHDPNIKTVERLEELPW